MGVEKWTKRELLFFYTLCTECELKKSHISLIKSNFNFNFLFLFFFILQGHMFGFSSFCSV